MDDITIKLSMEDAVMVLTVMELKRDALEEVLDSRFKRDGTKPQWMVDKIASFNSIIDTIDRSIKNR